MKQNVTVNLSPSLLTLLVVAMFVLKLTGYISISWFWVFSPLLLPFVIIGVILVFAFIVAVLFS